MVVQVASLFHCRRVAFVQLQLFVVPAQLNRYQDTRTCFSQNFFLFTVTCKYYAKTKRILGQDSQLASRNRKRSILGQLLCVEQTQIRVPPSERVLTYTSMLVLHMQPTRGKGIVMMWFRFQDVHDHGNGVCLQSTSDGGPVCESRSYRTAVPPKRYRKCPKSALNQNTVPPACVPAYCDFISSISAASSWLL